jgi:hypothetical protein
MRKRIIVVVRAAVQLGGRILEARLPMAGAVGLRTH